MQIDSIGSDQSEWDTIKCSEGKIAIYVSVLAQTS